MLSSRRILLLAIFLCIFLFSGSAYALAIGGSQVEAAVAQHFDNGVGQELLLVIEHAGVLENVKLQGLTKAGKTKGNIGKTISSAALDFFELTGIHGSGGVSYYELNWSRGVLKRLNQRGKRLSRIAVLNGDIAREDRVDFRKDYVANTLAKRVFRLSFDEGGQHYEQIIGFTTFNNPPEETTPDGGTSVPEPSMMLLLGTGLLGLAALRRRFK